MPIIYYRGEFLCFCGYISRRDIEIFYQSNYQDPREDDNLNHPKIITWKKIFHAISSTSYASRHIVLVGKRFWQEDPELVTSLIQGFEIDNHIYDPILGEQSNPFYPYINADKIIESKTYSKTDLAYDFKARSLVVRLPEENFPWVPFELMNKTDPKEKSYLDCVLDELKESPTKRDGSFKLRSFLLGACEFATRFIAVDDPINWWNLGVAYSARGEGKSAIVCFEEARKLTPNSPRIWELLAEIYAKEKAAQKSLDAINKALILYKAKTIPVTEHHAQILAEKQRLIQLQETLSPNADNLRPRLISTNGDIRDFRGVLLINTEWAFLTMLEDWLWMEIPLIEGKKNRNTIGFQSSNNHITFLALPGLKLTRLPNPIPHLPAIKHLDLSRNNFESIPQEVWSWTTLVELDVGQNKISTIPNDIQSLKSLQTLNVEQNQIQALPKSLVTLSALSKINANANKISKLSKDLLQAGKTIEVTGNPCQIQIAERSLAAITSTASYKDAKYQYRQAKEQFQVLLNQSPTELTSTKFVEILRAEQAAFLAQFMEKSHVIKILLMGSGGIGTTSLLERFINGKMNPAQDWTQGIDFYEKVIELNSAKYNLICYDFDGADRYRRFFPEFMEGASGGILLFDTTRMATLDDFEEWVNMARETNKQLPILLCGTKLDLVEERSVSPDYAKGFLQPLGLFDYLEVSARTGENVERAFETLIRKIIERERTSE